MAPVLAQARQMDKLAPPIQNVLQQKIGSALVAAAAQYDREFKDSDTK